MKKLMLVVILFFAVIITGSAQTSAIVKASKYWYYPDQNIYYNAATHSYWYYNKPADSWRSGKQLPPSYQVNKKTRRYEIMYNGIDVWKDNEKHTAMYKASITATPEKKSNPAKE